MTRPERHYLIDGRTPYSLDQLEEMASRAGLKLAVAVQTPAPPKKAPVKAAEPAKVPAKAPVKAAEPEKPPVTAEADGHSEESAKQVNGAPAAEESKPQIDGVEIPENLGALKFNELKSLAAKLGISPVPNVTADLLAAIEAKRGELSEQGS